MTLTFTLRLATIATVVLGAWRIGVGWKVLSQTYDEPFHIACGLEWVDRGDYTYEWQHPPLARIAAGIGLRLGGYHSTGRIEPVSEGNAILLEHGDYWRALALARAGNLFFYFTACLFVYLLATRMWDEAAAALATVLFAHLPAVIAHARLVTTDMAAAAGFVTALYVLDWWRVRPDAWRGVWLGVAFAFGALTKFSFFPFFAVSAAALLLARGIPPFRWRSLLAAAAVFVFLALAIYRFHPVKVTDRAPNVVAALSHTPRPVQALFARMPLGQMVRGLAEVAYHASEGHLSYLLGEFRVYGWWYFFPVVLAVKTPLAFWLLVAAAIVIAIRHPAPRPMLFIAAAILAVCMTSTLNLGVRHVLPIYVPLCAASGYAAKTLLQSHRIALRIFAAAILLWFASTIRFASNELSYFNALAGSAPEKIVVDSDLDWGQDLDRLRQRLEVHGVREFTFGYYGSADLDHAGLPPFTRIVGFQPVEGWVAVSISLRKLGSEPAFAWLNAYHPVERVGTSYDLYFIPHR